MDFITETWGVYCAVSVDPSVTLQTQPFTAETRVRFWFNPREVYGGRSGIDKSFSPSIPVFLLSASFHECCILFFTYIFLLPQEQKSEASKLSKKAMLFRKWGSI
jgi:hypothetical protein